MRDEDKSKEQLLKELKELRWQTREELNRSSALFSRVMKTSPAGIVVLDRDGKILTANLQASRVLGLARDQITGLPYNDPQWRITDYEGNPFPDERLPFRLVMETGQPVYDVQHAIEGPKGRRVLLSINAAPLLDESGRVEKVVATVEDVTQRVQTEKDLKQTRREWEEIFQAIGHATLIMDTDHTVISANRAAVKAVGKPEEEIIGKKCYEIFHSTDRPATGCPMEKMLDSGIIETVEMEMETLGGVFLVSCTPILDDHGNLQGIIHIATDITARKLSEEALREESSFRSAVINNAAEGLCVCHATTEYPYVRFTLWNEQMTEITGYTMEETNRLGWYQTVYPDPELQTRAKERMARMRQGDNLRGEPWEITRADGEKRIVNISTSILISTDSAVQVLALMNDVTERQRAEEELRQSEERLKLVLDGSQQGFWDWNLETGEVKRGELWAEMLGYKLQDISSSVQQWLSLIHPDDQAAAQKSLQDHLEGRTPFHEIECRMLTKNKQIKWILDRGRIVERDVNGRPLRMSGTHVDITERKQAAEALKESEEKYRLLVNQLPAVVFKGYRDWSVDFFDDKIETLTDYSKDDFESRRIKWDKVILPEDLDYAKKIFIDALKSDGAFVREHRIRRRDGEISWVQCQGQIFIDPGGKIDYISGVTFDITPRKQAEEALRQANETLRATLDAAPVAIFDLDTTGRVKSLWNPTAEQMLGWRRDEVLGQFLPSVPEDNKEEFARFRELIRSGKSLLGKDVVRRRKDGSLIEYSIYAAPVYDDDCQVIGNIAVLMDITERKQAEEALRESEEKYRLLVNQIPAVVFKGYQDWSVDFFDNKIEMLTGYSKEEFDSRKLKWSEVILPDDLQEVKSQSREAIKARNKTYEREYRIRKKDGGIAWVQAMGKIFYAAGGRFEYVSGVFFDTTERKQAEEALLKYKFIANTAKDCMTLIDRNYIYEAANAAYCQTLGKPWEEVVGNSVAQIWGAEIFEKVIKGYLDRCFAGQTVEFEGWFEFGARGMGCYHVFYSPYFDGHGKVAYAAVVSHDINERKTAEEALRQSEVKYRQLVDQIPAVVYKGYLDWTLDCFDRQIEEITGYAKEEFDSRRKNWRDLIFPEDVEQAKNLFRAALQGDGSYVTEHRIRKKSGEVRWIQARNRIIRNVAGRVDHISGVFFDITERKELEDQLNKAQRMEAIGILAGGLAHDFNNLMTAIMGYSEIMMIGLRKEDPFHLYVEEITKAVNRGASLTNQLLAFSRKQILQPRVINLNEVVLDMDKMLRRLIGEDIELITFTDRNLGFAKADPGQIEQIIMNLAVNARDAMPDGGKLTVETTNVYLDHAYARSHVDVAPGPYVLLGVSDNGLGMDAKTMARIFDPFFTTKESGKGTGLGLATVYGIVKQSGGHIWVYSEPGRGTTFKIYLPRVEEILAGLKPKTAAPVSLEGNETILVAEDDAALRELVSTALRKYGFKVLEAAHGGEALLICERHEAPIHLMLTDVVMPQISGTVLAERLKQLHPEMKVLYMSGYTENAIVHHGVLDSKVNFIPKPFRVLALVQKVREVLDSPEEEKLLH